MSNPFIPKGGKVRPPKRNARDLTRQSLFTSDWGKLYPFFCQEVIPGGSYRINASVGFRAMQTKFPLQSRIRTSCSFYYVRNRCLFDRWEDFIFKTKGAESGVVSPWLKIPSMGSPNAKILKTGSLGDALGVATTVGSSSSFVHSYTPRIFYGVDAPESMDSWSPESFNQFLEYRIGFDVPKTPFNINASPTVANFVGYMSPINLPSNFDSISELSITTSNTAASSFKFFFSVFDSNGKVVYVGDLIELTPVNPQILSIPDSVITEYKSYDSATLYLCGVSSTSGSPYFIISRSTAVSVTYLSSAIIEPTSNPHVGLTPLDPINALPFRAYEMIANYYFRNDLNSPYILDGEVQYNRFIPSTDGGADTNVYDFHFHNWELDRFVSALPTPQFGEAPLVGLNYRVGADVDGMDFTFQGENEQEYHATLGVKDDKVVSIVNFDKDLPSSNLQNLMQMVNAGFSINTLRDVNSFQRFLENCQRRGLRYRNQLQSHFGVNVDYPDIDVPQYIGGFSSWAEIGQVTNMAEMPNAGLGDYVGTISGMSSSKRDIDIYTPEHGFIIGIYCIYPTPIYTQSEPKYLKKHSPFDYFTPEFGKIGKVPIHYREISPLQTDATHKLDDVFGYQVPWYDYLDAQDTAHGDFRTTLRDFLIQRLWDSPPELCEDFVRVNPTQLNDIFTTRNIADAYGSNSRFLCSSITKCTALLPIPVHGVPSLE